MEKKKLRGVFLMTESTDTPYAYQAQSLIAEDIDAY